MTIKNYSKDFLEDFTADDDSNTLFNSQRLSPDKIKQNNFVDISDGYANEGMVITFVPIHVFGSVSFKAFITSYTETFSSDYTSEQVFGRIDPIHTFKQTTRNGTISFVIPSSTPSEAYESLHKVDKLRSMLYPSYVDTPNALTINQNPLVRIGVMNLLSDGANTNNYSKLFGKEVPNFEMQGALTVIKSMNINFNLDNESGVFEAGGTNNSQKKGVLPKLIEVAIDFSVIHERNMGRENLNTFETVYGISSRDYAIDGFSAREKIEEARQRRQDELAAVEADRSAAAQATRDSRIANFKTSIANSALAADLREKRRDIRERRHLSGEDFDSEKIVLDDEFDDFDFDQSMDVGVPSD